MEMKLYEDVINYLRSEWLEDETMHWLQEAVRTHGEVEGMLFALLLCCASPPETVLTKVRADATLSPRPCMQ